MTPVHNNGFWRSMPAATKVPLPYAIPESSVVGVVAAPPVPPPPDPPAPD